MEGSRMTQLEPARPKRQQDHSARQTASDALAIKVIGLFRSGVDTGDIADRCGISRSTVQRMLVYGTGRWPR